MYKTLIVGDFYPVEKVRVILSGFKGFRRIGMDSLKDANRRAGRGVIVSVDDLIPDEIEELFKKGFTGEIRFNKTIEGSVIHSKVFDYDKVSGEFIYLGKFKDF